MNNKKLVILILLMVILIGSIVAIFCFLRKPDQDVPVKPSIPPNTSLISIYTDETEYKENDTIKIFANNESDDSVLYNRTENRFWGLEYFKDDKWINLAQEKGGGFQLTEENIGNACYIAFYERVLPSKLKPHSEISQEWNQRICPFGTEDPAKPKTVKNIGIGKYRLVFHYEFKVSENDPYAISEIKTIYSNEFTIKSSDAVLDPKEYGPSCRIERTCGDLIGIDCNAAVDGPYYYVNKETGDVVSKCGGYCMVKCENCPPKEWNCDTY